MYYETINYALGFLIHDNIVTTPLDNTNSFFITINFLFSKGL